MKVTFILIIFALIFINVNAQAPDWSWARGAGGTSLDNSNSIATDINGNIYITGNFSSPTITFGAITLTNTSMGWRDIFIVKYDSHGNVLWAKSQGGTSGEYSSSVTTDADGNVIITGEFYSNSITFGTTTLFNSGPQNFFIAKYSALGNFLWAKSANSGNWAYSTAPKATTDSSGNVYVAGYCYFELSFGTITLPNPDTTIMMFLVKYDALGNVIWAKKESSTDPTYPYAISTDALGNVYVTGRYFSPSITFGTTILINSDTTGITPDMFIVKYNPSGNVIWAKGAGNIGYDIGMSVACDNFKNVYVSGEFSSPITFGSTTLINIDYRDLFIVKYNDSGNPIWAKGAGGMGYDQANCINLDESNNVYLSGIFSSDSITFGNTTLHNLGINDDIFIVKFDALGTEIWAKSAGSTGIDYGQSTIDNFGNLYLSGTYKYASTITFGAATLVNEDPLGNNEAIFIAKLGNFAEGIEKNNVDFGIYVYPNPSSGAFTIQNSNLKLQRCAIKNVLGENIFTQKLNLSNQINIDLSAQPKGIYFVEITDINNNYYNKKVVVE